MESKRLGYDVICPQCKKVVNPIVERAEAAIPNAGIKARDVVKCPRDKCRQVWYVTHI